MHLITDMKNLTRYDKAEDVPMGTIELGLEHYKKASDLGLTFWQYMEMIQPSKVGDNLTAFERQLALTGLILRSNPEKGLYSSPGEFFFQSDRPGSAILFPTLLQKVALWAKLKQVVDVNTILATTRTISGSSSYQALYIDDSEISGAGAVGRRFRVEERGKFPQVKIGWSEGANAVSKHGVELDWSYEFVRRASIELMTTVVARIMMQDQKELFNDAVTLCISGNGNNTKSNPAAAVKKFVKSTYAGSMVNKIRLDVANNAIAAGDLPYEGYLKWIGGFSPYTPSIVMGNLDTLVKLVTMSKPNMDPMEIITKILETKTQGTATTAQNLFPNVTLYPAEGMADATLMGLDPQFALERIIELGSDIKEIEKVIRNQTEAMVISIADNFSKIFPDAVQVLDFSAAPAA